MLQATSALTLSLLPAAAPLALVPGAAASATAASGSAAGGGASASTGQTSTSASSTSASSSSSSSSTASTSPSSPSQQLSADQEREIAWLESRDREVRSHEAAHQAAGGSLVAGVSFQFETGPDGRSYAIGGDVTIDVSSVPGNPQATVAKMRQVRNAALAPAQPSAQDVMVAAQAEEQELEAEMAAQTASASARAPSAPAAVDGASQAAPAGTTSAAATRGGVAAGVRQSHMIAAYAAAQATAAPEGMPPTLFA